ncbi:hypothetical protein KP509_07G099600 [Ceratopteris richardii]|uniref:SBP-type domain-containing protein n=1 Tax=Ceratopteris richardii TaxID=49495 RepID=A0A8T2UPA2_CERRI|nr:hypothetical protein KP509_07G099600 [Ceratopteris richardii]
MASNPSKSNSYACLNRAGFKDEDRIEKGVQGFAFGTSEANDLEDGQNEGMPLSVAMPAGTPWAPAGASSADGIISIAGNDGKRDTRGPPSGGPLPGSSESMLSLELGERTYFRVPGGSEGLVTQGSGSSLPRKHRIAGHTPGCQVDGCKSDLSTAKDYHRRHKVCVAHSKAPRVIVRGEDRRFCQQCSRFHGLDAFDEGKRSCRNRLEGHNRRRRKPQPDPLSLSARFLPTFQGMPSLMDDRNPTHQSRGTWQHQGMLTFDEQAAYNCSIPGGGIERQLFTGFHHHPNDRSTVFPPQSPKGMTHGCTDIGSASKASQYFQVSASPLGPSLSLTSSSGAGVLSGLEPLPVCQGFPRVSDSGRALSLQSTLQFLSSTEGIIASSLDMTTHSNIITNQSLRGCQIPTAQPLTHVGGHQPIFFEWTHDKLLPSSSSLYGITPTKSGCQAGSRAMSKDHLEGAFSHSPNSMAGFDCVPIYPAFQGDVRLGGMPQDAKPTIESMQAASSSSRNLNNQPLLSTSSFDAGMNRFQELHPLPPIYSSQEM